MHPQAGSKRHMHGVTLLPGTGVITLMKNATRHLLLIVAVAALTACGGAEQRKAKYLEKGKAYIEQENYDKAVIELRNALQIDPKLAEAY